MSNDWYEKERILISSKNYRTIILAHNNTTSLDWRLRTNGREIIIENSVPEMGEPDWGTQDRADLSNPMELHRIMWAFSVCVGLDATCQFIA